MLHIVQVHEQVLEVKRGPLAHGGRLGRLIVGEAKSGQIFLFFCKISEIGDNLDQRPLDQGKRALLDEQVGVADHELRGGAQVDDRLGQRTLLTIGEHVRHNVVADLAFLGPGEFVVDIVHMGLEFGDHVRGDRGQAEFMLPLGQGDPTAAPVGELEPFGKQFLHLPAGVAGHQGLLIDIVIHGQLVMGWWRWVNTPLACFIGFYNWFAAVRDIGGNRSIRSGMRFFGREIQRLTMSHNIYYVKFYIGYHIRGLGQSLPGGWPAADPVHSPETRSS